jgi:hypothetical protein
MAHVIKAHVLDNGRQVAELDAPHPVGGQQGLNFRRKGIQVFHSVHMAMEVTSWQGAPLVALATSFLEKKSLMIRIEGSTPPQLMLVAGSTLSGGTPRETGRA